MTLSPSRSGLRGRKLCLNSLRRQRERLRGVG
jgi:hypothetical protein